MKKLICLLLACVMMVCLMMTGCGSSEKCYTVFCRDAGGKGVPGVTVQVCNDEQCVLFTTGSDGKAACEGLAPGAYEIHILKCPEGFAYDSSKIVTTPESFGTIELTLESAPQEAG